MEIIIPKLLSFSQIYKREVNLSTSKTTRARVCVGGGGAYLDPP